MARWIRALAARAFWRGSPTIHVAIEGADSPSQTRAAAAKSVDRFWARLAEEEEDE